MLKAHIDSSGLTRAAWAKRLGVSEPYLSQLINRRKTPSLEIAGRIERETGGAVPAMSWLPSEAMSAASSSMAENAPSSSEAA